MSDFKDYLIGIKYPTKEQVEKEMWHVLGVLKERTNREYKFDLRPISNFKEGGEGKTGSFATKADKMVFDFTDKWVIIDIDELHGYIKDNKVKDLLLDNLILKLNWNIIVLKK